MKSITFNKGTISIKKLPLNGLKCLNIISATTSRNYPFPTTFSNSTEVGALYIGYGHFFNQCNNDDNNYSKGKSKTSKENKKERKSKISHGR